MDNKQKIVLFLDQLMQFAWGICFLLFPVFFLTTTTDTYILPKQILLISVVVLSLLGIGITSILQKKVTFRQSPLHMPVAIFLFVLILSSVFSLNRFDSLIVLTQYIAMLVSYFLIVHAVKKEQTAFFLTSSLVLGGCIAALVMIFSFSKVYLLPFAFTKVTTFTPLGSPLESLMYFVALLPICMYFAYPIFKGTASSKTISYALAGFLLVGGIVVAGNQLLTTQKPILLPYLSGFQIAFSAISQDTPRIAQGFFFGSGTGTFATDFTKFRPLTLNTNPTLWFVSFTNSSSYVWELLATTGVSGLIAFLFIVCKTCSQPKKDNPLFFSVCTLLLISLLLPFSFIEIALLFFLLALLSSIEGIKRPTKGVDLEFALVALRKSLFFGHASESKSAKTSMALPIVFVLVLLTLATTLGYFTCTYTLSDVAFNQSLVAANNNNGSLTYQKQVQAISTFPYRDVYYRTFSQTNLAIANSLALLNSGKNAKPTQQVQQTTLNLIQQAIATAKSATIAAPLSVANWQNIASVYRSLIGVGQNADTFALSSTQTALALDPNNPQEHVSLGGLYYQLGKYDDAIKEFQTAISLKPDFPNAYYNVGHAYEQKGDLQSALTAYENVKTLVTQDKTNLKKITDEITALQAKIGQSAAGQATQKVANLKPVASPQPLNLAQPTK